MCKTCPLFGYGKVRKGAVTKKKSLEGNRKFQVKNSYEFTQNQQTNRKHGK